MYYKLSKSQKNIFFKNKKKHSLKFFHKTFNFKTKNGQEKH